MVNAFPLAKAATEPLLHDEAMDELTLALTIYVAPDISSGVCVVMPPALGNASLPPDGLFPMD